MDIRLYLENGDGYIGLIYVADIIKNDKWQAIAHYPQNGPPTVFNDSKVDSAADEKLSVESFCQKNGIKTKPV